MTLLPKLRYSNLAGFVILLGLLLLSGCAAAPAKTDKTQFMFWPPAPDVPHIQFLTSISSSRDITEKQGTFEDIVYGEDKSRGLPFYRPYGIRAIEGNLYVCDASVGNVSVINFRKKEVRVLGTTGLVHLVKPIDIAIAPDGTKYIADTAQGAVLVYDAKDTYVGRVAVKGMRPVSVAVNAQKLYVSDIGASRVRIFDRFNGKELQTIGESGGGPGKFGGTMGLCIDEQGNLYVNDVIGCRVQKFSPEGKFISSLGGLGAHPGSLVRPKLMTVDSSGILYVVDNAFQNVQMFNSQGQLLMFFGGPGRYPGAMEMPAGVCVSDTDLDLFAKYVHPAFQIQRLIFVTNNAGNQRINIYALGELKPGKTVADISQNRVSGIFGFDTQTAPDLSQLPADATDSATQPGTQPATQPATQPRPDPALGPSSPGSSAPPSTEPRS
jgi:DNA-binding beta-propeller fold protein YncE